MIYDLLADFTNILGAMPTVHASCRIITLLDEAIKRDIHFIERHREDFPQALFQCLWNNGWWYDCYEAASHYEPQPEGSVAEILPWEETGARLAPLIEGWKQDKAFVTPGFIWLRSLRPPRTHLSTALKGVFRGHTQGVSSVAFSPDARRIASVSYDLTARVWDAETGEHVLTLNGHNAILTKVVFSPDGLRIATASHDNTIRIWDLETGRELKTLSGHEGNVTCLAFSPYDQWIISASEDTTVRTWDSVSGAELSCLRIHGVAVYSMALNGPGDRVALGCADDTIRIWDIVGGVELHCLKSDSHKIWKTVAFSSNDKCIFAGSSSLHVWDAVTGVRLHTKYGDGYFDINGIVVSADGQRLIGACSDGTIRMWKTDGFVEVSCLRGHDDEVKGVDLDLDGYIVVSCSWDRTIRTWSLAAGCARRRMRGIAGNVYRLSFANDGKTLEAMAGDETMCIYDVNDRTCIEEVEGANDIIRIDSDSAAHEWRLEPYDLETVLKLRESGIIVAWYPEVLGIARQYGADSGIAAHPNGRTWAGSVADYVCLLAVEGYSPESHEEDCP